MNVDIDITLQICYNPLVSDVHRTQLNPLISGARSAAVIDTTDRLNLINHSLVVQVSIQQVM